MTTSQTEPRPGGAHRRPPEAAFDFRSTPEEWGDWPCWIASRVHGLNVRSRPSRDAASVGRLDAGDHLSAKCRVVHGDEYHRCGGSPWWIPVYYRRRRCYVA